MVPEGTTRLPVSLRKDRHQQGVDSPMPSRYPNILVAISDDQGWPHAGAYGCRFVNTPAFDRVAREGVLFTNAFCPSPQCSPSRAGLLTGMNMWQIEEGGLLWSLLPAKYDVYPDLLEEMGYFVGLTAKGWGPGSVEESGRSRNPAGPGYNRHTNVPPASGMSKCDYARNFQEFMDAKPLNSPFCFWYGCHEPHRGYEKGSGLRAGKRLEDVEVPPYLPDCEETRSDLLDYGLEIDWFDTHLARMMDQLERMGELDNTLIIVTGDNGLPFPRAKANLYPAGCRVPLAICWPGRIPGGRTVTDFVSFIDLAPTILNAAGLVPPPHMAGRSLIDILDLELSGRLDPSRDHVLTGRERHACCRPANRTYASRSIHTEDFVYIRNYQPDRWPAGDPEFYGDIDDGPTKSWMMEHREDENVRNLFHLAFEKRPAEELYAMKDGYACLTNLADDPAFAETKQKLRERLESVLLRQRDPRLLGLGSVYESYPYYGAIRLEKQSTLKADGVEHGKYNPTRLGKDD